MKNNKLIKYLLYTALIFSLVVLISCKDQTPEPVAWVNGHPITQSELKHWMLLEKANTFNYFYQKYNIDESDHFWTDKFGGEVPINRLRKVALEKAVDCKVQQAIALKKGVIDYADFDAIVKELEQVNKAREKKVERGEPVYGPVKFTERTYFSYVFDKMVIDLKNKLAKKELRPDQEQLRELKTKSGDTSKNLSGFLGMQYVDQEYPNYVKKAVSNATLIINDQVYRAIQLN
jgi:hypothetical protein